MNPWLPASTFVSRAVRVGAVAYSVLVPAVAAAQPIVGVQVSGIARQFEVTCGTCPNPVTILSSTNDGGADSASSEVSFEDLQRASYVARATLAGPNSLPSLGAFAAGDVLVDIVQLTTFFHNATANARATQQYQYTGVAPATYTLEYVLEGELLGGPLSQLFGGFAVLGSDPQIERPPVLGSTFDSARGVPNTMQAVSLTGSVTFDIAPGESFFVDAQMFATADARDVQLVGPRAIVNAANTLEMRFVAGDTSLLAAALVSRVPPSLTLQLNGTEFPAGTTLTLTAILDAGNVVGPVDAYVVLMLPSGELLSLQFGDRFVPGLVPIVRQFTPHDFQGILTEITLSGGEPPGNYTWFAALTTPGTLNFVSPLQQLEFTVP